MAPRTYGRTKPVEPDLPPLEPQVLRWRHFRVEENDEGLMRVVGFSPNPATGEVERDTPEDAPWSPPPPGRWRSKLQLGSDGNPLRE